MAFRIFIPIIYIIYILFHFLFQFIFEHYCLCTFGTADASARIAQLTSPLNQKSASAARKLTAVVKLCKGLAIPVSVLLSILSSSMSASISTF